MDEKAIIDKLIQAIRQEAKEQFDDLAGQLTDNGRQLAVIQVANLLKPEESVAVRRQAALALTELGGDAAIAHLGEAVVADADPVARQLALSGLEKIDLIRGAPYLLKLIDDDNERLRKMARHALGLALERLAPQLDSDNPFSHDQAGAFLQKIGPQNLAVFLLEDDRPAVQSAAVQMLAKVKESAAVEILCRASKTLNGPNLLWSILTALREIGLPEVVDCLGERLTQDNNLELRRLAADALQQLALPTAVPFLTRALIQERDRGVRETVVAALARQPDWQTKTSQVIATLRANSGLDRANINGVQIVDALRPSSEELVNAPYLLTDHLIQQSLSFTERRIIAIMAALIIASAEGSMSLAGERLNAYQREKNIPPKDLQTLRIEIGGTTALSPILAELKENLDENFSKPIAKLNEQTQRMWRVTITFAQIGFLARTLMSVAVFVVGLYLVLDSYWQVIAGNLETEQLVGATVSFSTGLVTMLLMVYRGPLKEIRESVNDLGTASAAFIAYVHRVLQVSHTFAFYYLNERISFDEMEKSSRLIDEAMGNTVRLLRQSEKRREDGNNDG